MMHCRLLALSMASLCLIALLGCDEDVRVPGRTVDKPATVLAAPEWIPCHRDPNRKTLKHCSEEYRVCRESGADVALCLGRNYPVLTAATKPSQDEYAACRAARHTEEKCKEILEGPAIY